MITEFWGEKPWWMFHDYFWPMKIISIDCPLYEVKPGIKSINRNNFNWSKIITEHWSRVFFLKIRQSHPYVSLSKGKVRVQIDFHCNSYLLRALCCKIVFQAGSHSWRWWMAGQFAWPAHCGQQPKILMWSDYNYFAALRASLCKKKSPKQAVCNYCDFSFVRESNYIQIWVCFPLPHIHLL